MAQNKTTSKSIAIKTADLPALKMDEAELMKVLRSSLYPNAKDESIKLVLGYCKAAGLDPMQKPVHIVPIYDKNKKEMVDTIMPGIGLYRTQAARSGVYGGISEPEFGPTISDKVGKKDMRYPEFCKVTAKRINPDGSMSEFTATERWIENYAITSAKDSDYSPNAMWTKRPFAQLAKCAEAQALRKAFPEIGAQPTADEMEGREIHGDIIEGEITRSTIAQPVSKSAAAAPQKEESAPNKPTEPEKVTVNQIEGLRDRLTKFKVTEAEFLHNYDLEKIEHALAANVSTMSAWIRKTGEDRA